MDGTEENRHKGLERAPKLSAKLDESSVQQIRDMYRDGFGIGRIAKRFGVGNTTIQSLIEGKTWKHVIDPKGPIVMRPVGSSRGSKNSSARLTAEGAVTIRNRFAAGESAKSIAAAYGMTYANIRAIIRGEYWQEAKPNAPSKQLFYLRCSDAYQRYLDRLIKKLRAGGTQIPEGDYLKLAEYALARTGLDFGILAPRRVNPLGTNRHGEPKTGDASGESPVSS